MKSRSIQLRIETNQLVDEIYADLCNGLTTHECRAKMMEGLYDVGHYKGKKLSEVQSYRHVAKALELMNQEAEQERRTLRNVMYNRLLAVYQDAVEQNDRGNAIKAIETMMKLTGINQAENQTNIQINNEKEGITINFGFQNNELENNKDEY